MNNLPGSGVMCVWWLGVQDGDTVSVAELDVATELPPSLRIEPLPMYCLQAIGNRPLSVRARQSLGRYGINTVDELCRYPAEILLEARNFGETTLYEIETALAAIGRKLPMLTY